METLTIPQQLTGVFSTDNVKSCYIDGFYRGSYLCLGIKNNVTTNELLVLDTSPYDTRIEADIQQVVLRNRDANARFKSPVLKQLKNFCHKNSIDFSCKDTFIQEKNKIRKEKGLPLLTLGSTELGRIVMESKGSIQGTTLQIPTTGYHTVEETASIKSVKTILYILSSLYIDKKA